LIQGANGLLCRSGLLVITHELGGGRRAPFPTCWYLLPSTCWMKSRNARLY